MSPRQMPDVVVLLPGISGSVLAKDGKEVWGTSGGAVLRTLVSGGRSLRDLALVDDDPDAEDAGDGVTATGLVPDTTIIPGLWKIDGYTKVADALKRAFSLTPGENYFEFAYDWRRDNRASARTLARLTHGWRTAWQDQSGNANAKLILVAHSMGGLVARHFLEVLGGWQHTRALITFGTPFRGSLNALGYLTNGYSKGLGPVQFDLSPLLRSLTSIYQLLPIYECVDPGDGRLVRVAESPAIPNVDRERARQALAFHRRIEQEQATNATDEAYRRAGYTIYPIVGTDQPTLQSARLVGSTVEMLRSRGGVDEDGDGTVPRVSATPIELSEARREMYAAEAHGSLQNFDAVLTQVEGVLSGHGLELKTVRRGGVALGLAVDDAFAADEPVRVSVRPSDGRPQLVATVVDAATNQPVVERARLRPKTDDWQEVEFPPLAPGVYRVTVGGRENVSPVTDVFAVVNEATGAPSRAPTRGRKVRTPDTPNDAKQKAKDAASPPSPDHVFKRTRQRTRPVEDDEITDFLLPASPGLGRAKDAAADRSAPAQPDEGTSIVRHPSITPRGPARRGARLAITIDLLAAATDRETESSGVRVAGLPEAWAEIPITVELMSADLTFDPGQHQGTIIVQRNAASLPCTIGCTVNKELGGRATIEVLATFTHAGRFCGFARRSIGVDGIVDERERTTAADAVVRNPGPDAPLTAGRGSVSIDVGAQAPELTVRIFHPENADEGVFLWSLDLRERFEGLSGVLNGSINLGSTAERYARDLFVRLAELKPGKHMATLEGVGEQLWDRAPECFRRVYWAMREHYEEPFSIQFITDDPHIPWELMRPYRDDRFVGLLVVEHPVARWIARHEGDLRHRLPSGRIVTIAPKYRRSADRLEAAQGESARLASQFHATRVEGTTAAVTQVLHDGLPGEAVAVVHFAGHGEFGLNSADASRIQLEDGFLSVAEVGNQRVTLGAKHRTLVIFNACEVGGVGSVLGAVGGWAEAFTRRKFGGFLAPLWAVVDEDAATMTAELLDAVWTDRQPVGAALRRVRAKYGERSPTFFSYLFYGDVMAQVARPAPSAAHRDAGGSV